MIPITYELAKERMADRLREANLRLPLSTGYRSDRPRSRSGDDRSGGSAAHLR